MSESSSRLGWLCLRDCAVPIDSLEPGAIKASAHCAVAFDGTQPLRHQGILNAIAQALGAHGGWPGYPALFQELRAFLRRNRLSRRRDLLNPAERVLIPRMERRALADRLFESDLCPPDRLCLGLNFDWWSIAPRENYSRPNPIYAGGVAAAGEHWALDIQYGWNLLGDALTEPSCGKGFPLRLYFPNNMAVETVRKQRNEAIAATRYMRAVLESEPDAFVDLLRFNDRIFILRGPDNSYDLVFRDSRDGPPSTSFIGDPSIDLRDVPTALVLNSRFEGWYYRQRGVWEDAERHAAEEAWYRGGGTMQTYPGNVLERHYMATGRWHQPTCGVRSNATAPGWMKPVQRDDGSTLWVSGLVSVGELNAFLAADGYAQRRIEAHRNERDSDLTIANADLDETQPAAMTGLDAWAYCAFMERRLGLPIRPLTIAEYRFLRRDLPGQDYYPRPGDSDGPALMVPLPDDLVIKTSPDGVRFALHTNIGEWLFEHWGRSIAAVDTATLTSARSPMPLDRDPFPGDSWGRYKRTRIGLRLCFSAPAGMEVGR